MIDNDRGMRWELVHSEIDEQVRRYPVPGGWIYQVQNGPDWHPPIFVPVNSRFDGYDPE